MKILIITSCFAPKNVIGAVRVSKIAKYLIRDGHDLTIISPVLEDYDLRDETLECDEFKNISRITVPYSSLTTRLTRSYKNGNNTNSLSEIRNQINSSVKANVYRYIRSGFAWWRDYEWGKKVNSIIKKNTQIYDLVISSYPNLAPHYSALYAKRTGKAKKWIADFRDPLALDTIQGKRKSELAKTQSEIVNMADLTIHVSRAGTKNFICYPQDKEKVIWIPNGFDEEDFRTVSNSVRTKNNRKIVLAYAGGLYGGERDCSPLFKAIREMIDEREITTEDIVLDYAGKDNGILKKQADKYNVSEIICDRGLIPRTEAMEMQALSDCVVVATFCYRNNEGAMTGKIYEPVMMRRPVLLLVSGPGKNSEPGTFVNHLRAGVVYEESSEKGDVSKIKQFILELQKEKTEYGVVISKIDESARKEYEYRIIVKKLTSIIDRMELRNH